MMIMENCGVSSSPDQARQVFWQGILSEKLLFLNKRNCENNLRSREYKFSKLKAES